MKLLRMALFMGLLFNLTACSSVYYLYQAGRGQLSLLNRARPVSDVVEDPRTDPKLSELLKKIPDIKKYGESYGLKPTPNYDGYVKLNQDYVVYVVTVSEALQFKPKIFSFPIAGSFNYIGWFKEKDAREFGSQYEKQGLDVDVRGASAYSTLGWFKDPLLSSMIPTAENGQIMNVAFPDLVNVIIHESVHATLYIKNQSYFNESIASFVAEFLTQKFFTENHLLDSPEWKNYLEQKERSEKIRTRMAKAYQDLKVIYDSQKSDEQKKAEKQVYLDSLQNEFKFKRKINNAVLIQFQTYDPSDQGFGALFKKCNEDVRKFLTTLAKLKSDDFKHPQDEEFRALIEKLE